MSCEIQPARHNHQPTYQQGTKIAKNANLGPNLVVLGQKILILTGESKSFGTHITEKHLGTLFALFSGRAGTKWAKIANIWPKLQRNDNYGPKILILSRGSKNFGTHKTEKRPSHLVCIVFGRPWDQIGQKYQFWAHYIGCLEPFLPL